MVKIKITMFLFVALAAYLVEVQSYTAVEIAMSHGGPQNPYKTGTYQVLGPCGKKFGCHKGYCWAECFLSKWCYTKKPYPQIYSSLQCTDDSECDPCWKCGGLCTY